LLNVAVKILEKLLVRSLSDYIEANNLLDSAQHGFRRGRSTTTNLLECDNYIADSLNKGHSCDLVMIDFSRAFDRVDHNLLCCKLKTIGIDGC
jgi:hypothetical protein